MSLRDRVSKTVSAIIAAALLTTGLALFSGAENGLGNGERDYIPGIVYPKSGELKNVVLTVGRDESRYHATWIASTGSDGYLQWADASLLSDDGMLPTDCNTVAAIHEDDTFRAEMEGLLPEHSYAYRVGSDGMGWSPVYTFSTGAADDERFSFVAVGDPQIGTGVPEVDAQGWNLSLEHVKKWFGGDVEFLLSLGDQVNSADAPTEFDMFAMPEYFHSLPLMSVPGNHDSEWQYSTHYTYTGVDQATTGEAGKYGGDYWVAHDGVLFINLNSIDVSKPLHRDFIERAIKEYTEEYGEPNWKIVSLHYSAYSGAHGRWDSSYREEFSPIFSDLGIDAVLSGHDHVFARAYISDLLTPVDDPARYVEVGGDPFGAFYDPKESEVFYMTANSSSGSKFYAAETVELPYLYKNNQENVPNVTKVDVTADMLTFTTYRTGPDNSISDVVDFFALHRREGVTEDRFAPVLTVPTEDTYIASEGFDLTKGVSAYDNFDGDLTADVKISGQPDPTKVSVITYTVTDKAGNTATAQRRMIPVAHETAVSTEETVWRYLDDGTKPFDYFDEDTVSWTFDDFDDSEWSEAKGAFGAFDGQPAERNGRPVNTLLNMKYPETADEAGENIPNFFFRTRFDLKDPGSVDRIRALFWVDDAAEIFINGVTVRRISLGEDEYPWNYCSTYNPKGGSRPVVIDISDPDFIASLGLKEKDNVLAVELYQVTGESEDIYLDFCYLDVSSSKKDGLAFTDVFENTWYYLNVAKAYARGLFAGVSESAFAPFTGMTRAMVWRVLSRAADAAVPDGEKWYSGSQQWAMENGVSDGTNPTNGITREQLITMLYALSGKPDADSGRLDGFKDADSASKWAVDALCWGVENGLITGRGGGILDPKADVTRAEACTIIIKYIENVK